MATKGGKPDNLVPLTTEKAREIGAKGGKRSGEVKREKILMSKIYADFLAGKYDIRVDEKLTKTMTGTELVNETIKAVLMQAESASVSMLKEIREATEGNKTKLTGDDGGPVEISVIKRVIVDKRA